MTGRQTLKWTPSPHARRCLTLVALALLAGFALNRPELMAVAAAPLGCLLIADRRQPPGTVDWSIATVARCFENEPVTVGITVRVPHIVDTLTVDLRPGPRVTVLSGARGATTANVTSELSHSTQVVPDRWGRRRFGVFTVLASAQSGLLHARVRVPLDEVAVFPSPAPMRHLSIPATRVDQVGEHVSRRAGPGVEFAAIRPFSYGDPLARINWTASLRTQQLQVTQTAAERAVDLVVVLDCFDDVGPPGLSSLDRTVRAATGLARLMLATHDRVGVVALGGWLRWVRPDLGTRQFYRVADAMLDVIGRESFVDPDLSRVAPGALPPGCVLVMFSPLLDERALAAVRTLRGRGHPVTVVDVLTVEPAARRGTERLALRLWRLRREVQRAELADIGIPVVTWEGTSPLDVALAAPLRRGPSRAGAG